MCLKSLPVMFLWLLFLRNVITLPTGEEYRGPVKGREVIFNDVPGIKYIITGSFDDDTTPKPIILQIEDVIDKDNEHFKTLNRHIEAGHTMNGLTFTIYDDEMREIAIALFRLFQSVENDRIKVVKDWARKHINKSILEYVLYLVLIHKDDTIYNDLDPPFVSKPNYFLNSDTIYKAIQLKANNGKIEPQFGKVNQIFKIDDMLMINTNYSGWNHYNMNCRDNLDYFRQDISLNSFYYGVHLQYPFWMSNEELTTIDSKYAERYYYIHKNLLARYNLEKEHLRQRNIPTESKCYDDFVPYLCYENGIPFPSRSSFRMEWNEEYAKVKSIDLAIKEFINRGVIFMDNGTKIDLTEKNYVDLLTKLIRANYDSVQTAKIVRALFGYGGNVHPSIRYNPAPSVLHHPQTSLRDPIYWTKIQNLLNYFTEYSSTLEPYDFSKYKTNDIDIIESNFSRITTYYYYFHISLNNIFDDYKYNFDTVKLVYTARQKRITHLPFSLDFTVNSKANQSSLIKLFLGPRCQGVSCWENFLQFYELDTFCERLDEGLNIIKWSPRFSGKYSIDEYYDVELKMARSNRFDMLKFPENLVIPKGLNEGLNLTLFILILPYNDLQTDFNNEPMGFPFHRQVSINGLECNNYKFYNISIYHKENSKEMEEYFSPNLN